LSKTIQTKERIIKSATKLFAEKGFSATTTAEIAKEAQISEATIFKYFKDKQTLLKEVFKQAYLILLKEVALMPLVENIEKNKDLEPLEFLHSIIQERFDFISKNVELIKILIIEVQYNKELHKQLLSEMLPEICKVRYTIESTLMKNGGLSKETAIGVVRIIVGLATSFFIERYLLQIDTPDQTMKEEIDAVFEIIKKSI